MNPSFPDGVPNFNQTSLVLWTVCYQMGSSFKSAVFADDVADHLRGWANDARERMRRSSALGAAAAAGRSLEEKSRPAQIRSISF
jgi:mlo protein